MESDEVTDILEQSTERADQLRMSLLDRKGLEQNRQKKPFFSPR
jgi:hypothetical protein